MNTKYTILFSMLIFISLIIHFGSLDWGTPNWERSLQVFDNKEQIIKYIPEMMALREKHYTNLQDIIYKEGALREKIAKTFDHNLRSGHYKELPREVTLDIARGYLLGTVNSDEQQTMAGISNINPNKLDFNPDDFIYGGFYFYSAGAMLAIGKLLGIISLNRNADYYFLHPEEIMKMYTLIRFISALSVIGSLIILFLIVKSYYGNGAAFLSSVFLSLSPLIIFCSNSSKPHAYCMFWTLLGVYMCINILSKQKSKYYIFSGISFGLAAGSLITCLPTVSLIFLTEYYLRNKKIKCIFNRRVIAGFGAFILTFFCTNYYLFFNFGSFLRNYQKTRVLWRYGSINIQEIVGLLFKDIPWAVNWLAIPVIILGIFHIIKNKSSLTTVIQKQTENIILIFTLLYFLFNFIFFRHPGLLTIIFPFISLFFGVGCLRINNTLKIYGIVYIGLCLVALSFYMLYSKSLYTESGNLKTSGQWIDSNIPESASIGVPRGWFGISTFPTFKFMKYRLKNFPINLKNISVNKNKLPQYLVLLEEYFELTNLSQFKSYYSEIISWPAKRSLMRILFGDGGGTTYPIKSKRVKIFKLKQR